MLEISTTELKTNLGKYLDHVNNEDILITKNGKAVAKLVSQKTDKVAIAKSLFGVIENSINYDELFNQRRDNL